MSTVIRDLKRLAASILLLGSTAGLLLGTTGVLASTTGASIACACGVEEEGLEFEPAIIPLKVPEEPKAATLTIKNKSKSHEANIELNNTEKLPFKLQSTTCGAKLAPLGHCEDKLTVTAGTGAGKGGVLLIKVEKVGEYIYYLESE